MLTSIMWQHKQAASPEWHVLAAVHVEGLHPNEQLIFQDVMQGGSVKRGKQG